MPEPMTDERLAQLRLMTDPRGPYREIPADNFETACAVRDALREIDRLRVQQGIPQRGIPHVQYGVAFPDDDNVMTAPTIDVARAWVREYANLTSTTGAARVQRRVVTRSATAWEDVDG